MLTINGPGGPRPAERKAIRPSSGSSGFHVPTPAGLGVSASCISDDIQSAPIDGPGAAASASLTSAAADRVVQGHADEMLNVLGQIQRDMLSSNRDPAMFRRLAALADAVPATATPGLRQAMLEVATRAKVELARDQVAALGRAVTAT